MTRVISTVGPAAGLADEMSMMDILSPMNIALEILLVTGGAAAIGAVLILGWGVLVERHWWQETRQRVDCRSPGQSTAGSGRVRIVLLSDFHLQRGARLDPALVARVNALQADLLLLAGDFIDDDRGIAACGAALGGLRARCGAFAVLGNHDHLRYGVRDMFRNDHTPAGRNNVAALVRALGEVGIRVLVNESVRIRVGAVSVHLLGLGDQLAGALDLPRARARFRNGARIVGPRIVLGHSAPPLEEFEPDHRTIGLAGHTHGGQIRIPRFSDWWLKRRLQLDHLRGWRESAHGGRVYVNRGIGTSRLLPIRVNARPELAVFDLVADACPSRSRSEAWAEERSPALAAEDSAPVA